jgi:fumarate hydratase class I
MSKIVHIDLPMSEETARSLHVGDQVFLSGVMVTARDAAHAYMVENFINREPPPEEQEMLGILSGILEGGVIYHCGPVVRKVGEKWEFVAAGPTTSIREEPYEDLVMERFKVRGVIGKGGMGPRTLAACQKVGGVYLHAVGGAATLIARSVEEVVAVHKMEFGVPEAFWVIRVRDFPCVVTMDSHGKSIHTEVKERSSKRLSELIG